MKKLALALVCLVSVAFFASCDPTTDQPEPSIAVLSGVDYVNGTVDNPQLISMDDPTDWKFGFHVESNAVTKVELATLKVTYDYIVGGEQFTWDSTYNLAGLTSFDYVDNVFAEEKVIILENTVRATVTDADGQVNNASLAYKVDMPDQPLETYNFEWVREGGGQLVGQGLAEFGLEWKANLRDNIYAVITPMEDATLFIFQPEDWNKVTTEFEKLDFFNEHSLGANQFKSVLCSGTHDYDFVIGTIYQGECRLIHVTHSVAQSNPPYGTKVTITGDWK